MKKSIFYFAGKLLLIFLLFWGTIPLYAQYVRVRQAKRVRRCVKRRCTNKIRIGRTVRSRRTVSSCYSNSCNSGYSRRRGPWRTDISTRYRSIQNRSSSSRTRRYFSSTDSKSNQNNHVISSVSRDQSQFASKDIETIRKNHTVSGSQNPEPSPSETTMVRPNIDRAKTKKELYAEQRGRCRLCGKHKTISQMKLSTANRYSEDETGLESQVLCDLCHSVCNEK